ncbi:MAG: Gfo/Idh/MocA family oxidoreductase [Firmicutes bacterium]|nr:Gfo/Idh/MocA family oxidoreductase [Bacillota bacterium]
MKLKVGVIGTGLAWERLHYPAFMELADKYEIAALCDLDRSRAERWGRLLGLDPGKDVFTDYYAMLERPDLQVIDILVPISKNHPIAEVAAQTGKAVILEKPMGATLEQALATKRIFERYDGKVLIAENYRYSEEFNLIKKLIGEKRVGDPVFFIYHSTSCFPCAMTKDTFSATEWRQHPDYPGGDILDAAVHNLAGIRHVFGGIEHLQAYGVEQGDDFSPYAAITVNLKFLNGVIGEFSYYPAGQEPQKPLVGLRIFCQAGMIYLEDTKCGIINIFHNDGRIEPLSFQPERGYYNELSNLYNAVLYNEPIKVTPEVEWGDVKTVFAILQSITDEEIVKVDREYALA